MDQTTAHQAIDRVDYLDGLRGLAALGVVITHFICIFLPSWYLSKGEPGTLPEGIGFVISQSPLNLIYFNGNFAICIFFMLSGYVLSYSFFTRGRIASLKFNVIKRYFRLLFPIVFAVLVSYVVLRLGLYYNQAVAAITGSGFAAGFYTFTASLPYALWEAFFGVLFFNQTLYDDPLWTVAMEFYGSVMVFILLMIFAKNPTYRFYVYAVLISVFFIVKPLFLPFVLGMFLCDLNTRPQKYFSEYTRASLWLIFVIGLLLASVPQHWSGGVFFDHFGRMIDESPLDFNNPTLTHTIGAFLVMIGITNLAEPRRFLSMAIPKFLGRISYAMYVLHFIVLFSLTCWLFLALYDTFGFVLSVAISLVLSLAVIFAASYAVTRLIDDPGIRFSKWVAERWGK